MCASVSAYTQRSSCLCETPPPCTSYVDARPVTYKTGSLAEFMHLCETELATRVVKPAQQQGGIMDYFGSVAPASAVLKSRQLQASALARGQTGGSQRQRTQSSRRGGTRQDGVDNSSTWTCCAVTCTVRRNTRRVAAMRRFFDGRSSIGYIAHFGRGRNKPDNVVLLLLRVQVSSHDCASAHHACCDHCLDGHICQSGCNAFAACVPLSLHCGAVGSCVCRGSL